MEEDAAAELDGPARESVAGKSSREGECAVEEDAAAGEVTVPPNELEDGLIEPDGVDEALTLRAFLLDASAARSQGSLILRDAGPELCATMGSPRFEDCPLSSCGRSDPT